MRCGTPLKGSDPPVAENTGSSTHDLYKPNNLNFGYVIDDSLRH